MSSAAGELEQKLDQKSNEGYHYFKYLFIKI